MSDRFPRELSAARPAPKEEKGEKVLVLGAGETGSPFFHPRDHGQETEGEGAAGAVIAYLCGGVRRLLRSVRVAGHRL